MEERIANIMINKSGGNSGRNSKNYRVSLPSLWIKQLGISEDNRQVTLQFDGECIRIAPVRSKDYQTFLIEGRKQNHQMQILYFYDDDTLCTKICADLSSCQVAVENLTDDLLRTAMGNNPDPSWKDYQDFLEERCIPRQRDGLRSYLKELGLDQYDAFEIIRKTEGRMAEDHHWIRIVEG